MDKTIDTLIEDIYTLLKTGVDKKDLDIDYFSVALASKIADRLRPREVRELSMSSLDTPYRKLWFKMNTPKDEEPLDGPTLLKFLYGDIIEELLLFLVHASGHRSEMEQMELEYHGVLGHIDAVVDGNLIDVKSTSKFAYEKFRKGLNEHNDSFGYLGQLQNYMTVMSNKHGYFLVMNKESGELLLHPVESNKQDLVSKIDSVKDMLAQPTPPEKKCYDPVPHGKSGNMKLHSNCSYCGFKTKCWDKLTVYNYSSGPIYFTKVVKEPMVEKNETF